MAENIFKKEILKMSEEKIVDVYERRIVQPDYDVEEIRQRYLKLYTALIYDAMESIGLPGRSMESGIYPLTTEMKVAGPAFTVRRQTTPNTVQRCTKYC